MIYLVKNTAASQRVFYDMRNQEIKVDPGCVKYADINEGTLSKLLARNDLIVQPASFARHAPFIPPAIPHPSVVKPPVVVTGHFGIGDNLHQRAVMRELMKQHEVWLHTCHFQLFHDLVEQGLKLILRPTSLHAQAKTIAREQALFAAAKFPQPPSAARELRIGYPKVLVDQHGSILEAMFSCVGLKMPERPDFSMPLKPEWREGARGAIRAWNPGGKPVLIHRPVVVRNEWDGRSRNPDVAAYDELYRSIRDQFFVVSIADLAAGREWIDGPQQQVDIKLHAGELPFEQMAGLFAEANLVFCNAGFAPVLAQAVGTPVAVVYGGRESYRTTQRVGVHLAPTLPIDPINPCDCHSNNHKCDKRIDLIPALSRLQDFALDKSRHRTLLFGTFYVDSPDRDHLTDLWERLHFSLNERDCDFLAVDSQSPIQKFAGWHLYDGTRQHRMYFNFPDNIGHLSRAKVTRGLDGWGRAFCKGLEIACELGYEYVAHIEGDSLLRLRVSDIVRQMKRDGIDCASTHVNGRFNNQETEWIETGLMFMTTDYVRRSNFIQRYDWPNRKVSPTPERYILQQILRKDLNAKQLRIMPWKAIRSDRGEITTDNVLTHDWITHQHDSSKQDIYRSFVAAALKEVMPSEGPSRDRSRQDIATLQKEVMPADSALQTRAVVAVPQLRKLNLGCGTNKLADWENHDADVDITKRLPWPDGSASHISIEHCVEHIPYKAAIGFFQEACRVLAPGGVLRVTVPSLEQIAQCEDATYYQFTTKWQPLGPTKRGAMHAIIYAHGHECAWNAQLIRDTLYFAGFDDVQPCQPGQSADPILQGVEGHGRVIGDTFNRIESCTHEARKPPAKAVFEAGPVIATGINVPDSSIAIVVGGAECWAQDLAAARAVIGDRPVRYFYVNDHIKTFPEHGVACTLHPDNLNGHIAWLTVRRKAGLPEPDEVWAHRRHPSVTNDTASVDWRGSSGLFAVQVARRNGHRWVIACGVPMTVDGSHFERHQKWQSAISFRDGWVAYKNDLAPWFRSMSGWTAEIFGKPDEDWLRV